MLGLLPTPGALGSWRQGSGRGRPAKVNGFGGAPSLEDPTRATVDLHPALSSPLSAEAAWFKNSFSFAYSERWALVQILLTSRGAWPRQSLLKMVLVW